MSQANIDTYLAHTSYEAASQIKKLKFIYSVVNTYCEARNKEFSDISILEVGHENGSVTLPLASLGCQVRAFDVNAEYVEFVRGRIRENAIENLVVSQDSGDTFSDAQTYDILIISEVYQVLQHPAEFTQNMMKRIRVGSYFITTVTNGYGPWELKNRLSPIAHLTKWNRLRRWLGKPAYNPDNSYANNFYSKKEFLALFSDYPFEIIQFGKSDTFAALLPASLGTHSALGQIDIKVADWLPYWLVNGWYFALEMKKTDV